jgi:peroxiredoxin
MGQDPQRRELAPGDIAPAFEFVAPDAKRFRSSDLFSNGPVVLTFYRGAWCMCCQSDLRDLMRAMPMIRRTGSTVLGVFYELGSEANAQIVREYALDFPLVDDVDGRAAEGFGVRRSRSEMAATEDEFGEVPLALREGQPWIIPMQARFVIGRDGVVARSEVVFDYNKRSSAEGLIPVLTGLV